MDINIQNLTNYISHQLQIGISPDEIQQQLLGAGHTPDSVHQAFTIVQQQTMPSAPTPSAHGTVAPAANGQKRGRIRTGWILLKQSLSVLSGNRGLLRYLGITYAWIIGINLVFFGIYFLAFKTGNSLESSTDANGMSPIAYVLAFAGYIITYFVINFYATALAANMLDIFKGQKRSYTEYIGVARGKAGKILIFSIISATVGMFLQYVVERIRFIGWILAYILGTAWNLGTMFVLPIIADEDASAPASIKRSIALFKQTWGESITAKITVNAPLFLIQLALIVPFFLLLFGAIVVHSLPLVIFVIVLYVIAVLSLAVLGSFANSLINTALYYYAASGKIPAAFSADMLNGIMIPKTKRGFLGLFKK
ncbi:hypothetical protein H7Y63_04195 [Polaromonas sp.]|nr:hypothetical protein [Candidatus Saccharibacteria bacterium]